MNERAIMQELQQLIDDEVVAVRNKDIKKLVTFFMSEVVQFDVVGALKFDRVENVETRMKTWFSSFEGAIAYNYSELILQVSERLAVSYCLRHVNGQLANGGQLNMWWRETTCYFNTGDQWMITHRHSSVPFDTTSGKALTGLTPDDPVKM